MILMLIVLGLIPLLPGGLMYLLLVLNDNQLSGLVHVILTLLTLALWGGAAYFAKQRIKNTAKVLLLLHVVPVINLILLGIQEFVLNHYQTNFLGTLTQIYIVPFARICGIITGRLAALLNDPCGGTHWFSATVFATGLWGFLMMLATAFIGCKLNKR